MYYLFVVTLEDCPYSLSSLELLNSYKIKYKNLNVKRIDKEKYKTNEIDTFPQIYLKKTPSNDSLLLGGYSNLKEFVDTFINKKYSESNIDTFQKKYQLWTKKPILRLLEIINK
jgi:glutaredoxin